MYAETVEIRRRLAGEPVDDPDAAAAVERLGRARSGEWRAGDMSEWLHEAPKPGPDRPELRGWLSIGQRKLGLHFLLIEPGGKKPAAIHPRGVHDATDCPVALAGYLDRYAEVYPGRPVNVAVALSPSRLAVFDADLPGELDPLLERLGVSTPTVRSPGSLPSRTRPDADGVVEWVRSHHGGGHLWLVVPDGVEVPRVRHRKGEQADLRHGDAYVLMPPSIREPGPYEAVGSVGVLDDDLLGRIADMIDPGPARGVGSGAGTRSGRRDRASQQGDPRLAAPGDTLRRSVRVWEDATPWGDLLGPQGWDSLERPDGCGCEVWTAPGDHASDRSATAHDDPDRSTCGVRLHIWTDDPGRELTAMLETVGSASLSKLYVYAAYRTGGDVGAAIAELGLDDDEGRPYDAGLFADPTGAEHDDGDDDPAAGAPIVPTAEYDVRLLADRPESWARAAVEGCDRAHAEGRSGPRGGPPANWFVVTAQQLRECGASLAEIAELTPLDAEARRQVRLDYAATLKDEAAEIADRARAMRSAESRTPLAESVYDHATDFGDLTAPVELVAGLIEAGTPVHIIAPPNVGKTFFAVALSCDLAQRGRPVVYVVADDSRYQFVRRVLGWCAAHGVDPGVVFGRLRMICRATQFADQDDMAELRAIAVDHAADLVVIDTQHQCSAGIVENSNDDMLVIQSAVTGLISTDPGPAVALVHHTVDGQTGRGGKSMHAYMTTVLSLSDVEHDGARYLKVVATKQKSMARGKPIMFPFEPVEIPESMAGSVIADRHRRTLVVRTAPDQFATARGDAAGLLDDIRRYCVLWALSSTPDSQPATRIAADARAHAKPLLGSRDLLTATGNMPRGFARGDISRLLMTLVEERLIEESSMSTAVTTRYEVSSRGAEEQLALARYLGVDGEK